MEQQNQEIEFYEYMINLKKCEIIQRKCVGVEVQENRYRTKFYDYNTDIDMKRNRKLVDIKQFEIMQSFRIFSFKDDYEHYKQLLIDEYEQMIEKNRAKLEKQEQFLEQLKS